jgi:hypothetical protein
MVVTSDGGGDCVMAAFADGSEWLIFVLLGFAATCRMIHGAGMIGSKGCKLLSADDPQELR